MWVFGSDRRQRRFSKKGRLEVREKESKVIKTVVVSCALPVTTFACYDLLLACVELFLLLLFRVRGEEISFELFLC